MMFYILYKTTNLINNKSYIGIHQTNNLDDGYLGSGLAIKRAIKKYGKENFKREILENCSSYADLIQKEKIHVDEIWITKKDNYNLKTGGQNTGILSEESKKKISETLKNKYLKGEIKYSGIPWNPSDEQKEKISETLKKKYAEGKIDRRLGRKTWDRSTKPPKEPWNKGITLGPLSESQKEKISNTQKERIKNNPELKQIQSKKLKEFYKNNPHPTKGINPWNKGVEMKKIECPHCKKMVDTGNGKRWHFDNCKFIDHLIF